LSAAPASWEKEHNKVRTHGNLLPCISCPFLFHSLTCRFAIICAAEIRSASTCSEAQQAGDATRRRTSDVHSARSASPSSIA
jgi:hypothetical protein